MRTLAILAFSFAVGTLAAALEPKGGWWLPAAAVLLAVFVHPTTYWGLIPPGLAFVAVYGISVWLFGMNRYERGLVTGPLRRLTRRRKRGGGHRAP